MFTDFGRYSVSYCVILCMTFDRTGHMAVINWSTRKRSLLLACLEQAVLHIFDKIDTPLENEDIEVVHRLPAWPGSIKPTIVRFRSQKTVERIHPCKGILRNLSSLNLQLNGLQSNSSIFIRPSLCPDYKQLAYNGRMSKRNDLISQVYTNDDGSIKIKGLNNSGVKLNHENDLRNNFEILVVFRLEGSPQIMND